MTFRNSILAGVTLIREAIQSQNYEAGSEGWTIDADGHAEFNDIVIRGGTVVSGLALYYNGPPALGNLILSIAAQPGTDEFGNDYVQGLGVYGAGGVMQALGAELTVTSSNGSAVNILTGGAGQANMELVPRDLVGTVWNPAEVSTTMGGLNRPGLQLSSPSDDVNTQSATIILFGGGPTTTNTDILFGAGRVNFNNNVQVSEELSAKNIQSDTVVITPTVANEWTANTAVVFDEPFDTLPVVMLTCTAGGPGSATTTELETCAASVTTTGFNCRIRRGNLTATTLSWLAISTLPVP